MTAARLLSGTEGLPNPVLGNHLPQLIESLAGAMERGDTTEAALGDIPAEHALQRFHEGYDLQQIIAEYRLLRRVVLEVYAEHGDMSPESRPRLAPLTVMHEALDRAIADAVDHHAMQAASERERFIGILGHDLRDPLNAIIFAAETLGRRADALDPQSERLIAHLTTSSRRMAAMVRDMLDFARGRLGGGLRLVPSELDARELLLRTVGDIALAHPRRRIDTTAAGAPGNFDVAWDGERVTQALVNLVSNAIAHGHDPIEIGAEDCGDTIAITVTNAGEIPHGQMPRLFEPFVSGARQQRHGLGLGLYIVKEVARAHGGTVQAESAGGHTVFRMILPRVTTVRTPVAS